MSHLGLSGKMAMAPDQPGTFVLSLVDTAQISGAALCTTDCLPGPSRHQVPPQPTISLATSSTCSVAQLLEEDPSGTRNLEQGKEVIHKYSVDEKVSSAYQNQSQEKS